MSNSQRSNDQRITQDDSLALARVRMGNESKRNGLAPHVTDRHELFRQTLTAAQVDFLLQRTPKHEIKYRQGRGGMQFAYVEHGYVTERLNLVFGFNWDFEIVDKQILEDEVIVEARLTVRTPGGQTIVKTQFGGAEIKRHTSGPKNGRPLSIADDYKAAASDALKKCASLLGIGLDLYGRDRPDEFDPESDEASTPGRRTHGSWTWKRKRAHLHPRGVASGLRAHVPLLNSAKSPGWPPKLTSALPSWPPACGYMTFVNSPRCVPNKLSPTCAHVSTGPGRLRETHDNR